MATAHIVHLKHKKTGKPQTVRVGGSDPDAAGASMVGEGSEWELVKVEPELPAQAEASKFIDAKPLVDEQAKTSKTIIDTSKKK